MNKADNIKIYYWMLQNLGLTTSQSCVYAFIYHHCKENNNDFTGSIGSIVDYFSINRSTAKRALSILVNKGLLIKLTERTGNLYNIKYKIYFATLNKLNINYKNEEDANAALEKELTT